MGILYNLLEDLIPTDDNDIKYLIQELSEFNENYFDDVIQNFNEARVGGRSAEYQDEQRTKGTVGKIKGGAVKAADSTASVVHNTGKTIKDSLHAYDSVTTSGGLVIKSIWNIVMSLINLSNRLIGFIARYVSKFGNMIAKLINNINKIPDSVRNKINGNIQLYITKDDFDTFKILEKNFDKYILLLQQYTKGFTFSDAYFNNNDLRLLKSIKEYYKGFENIQFEKTTILLKDKLAFDIYFNKDSQYYKNMIHISEWLEKQKAPLEQIQKDMESKFTRTNIEGKLSSMKPHNIEKFKESLNIIGKTMVLLSNIGKCIHEDLKTISVSTDEILKKIQKQSEKKLKTEPKKSTNKL